MVQVEHIFFNFEVASFFFGHGTNALVDIRNQFLALNLKYFIYDFLKQSNFPCKVLVFIMVIHHFEDFSELLVTVDLLAFKPQVKSKFPEAACTKGKRFPVGLLQL